MSKSNGLVAMRVLAGGMGKRQACRPDVTHGSLLFAFVIGWLVRMT